MVRIFGVASRSMGRGCFSPVSSKSRLSVPEHDVVKGA